MTTDLFSLQGKRALVTGGTRGIGRAIAMRFARAGAVVIANYVRDVASAEALTAAAEAEGLRIELCRADLTSPKGMEQLLEQVQGRFETLSSLVHCAATGVHKPLEQLTPRHFDWTFALNARAFMDLVIRLLPRFDPQGASVLGISSEGATRAIPQYTVVGASKGALEALVRHMAVELAPRGIRVNTLACGTIATDAWKSMPDAEIRLADAARRSPRGQLVSLEEVACCAQFLCSDAAAGIIGQAVVVDGGVRILA
ncbi:MAG: SDR family oxidoreductase [Desulfobacterales bacterium]|jgi:enoyl-[acyl-carrier protein] reductase III|nr:SDR family oxidoreductase [Desulfobacterales bacterium]